MSTVQLAIYVRDLLTYDEQLIKIGRTNFERKDFEINFIVVDEIDSQPQFITNNHDGDAEEMTTTTIMQGAFTLDFFGVDARTNAITFIGMNLSQLGYELQRDMGLAVMNATNMTDLKYLTGTQYGNRYQLQFQMRYNETLTRDVLNIETAQIEVHTETNETVTFETD
tara:strand:- start:980 stop:1483 length:504 start_codon:yes stop_codon:yes gene_type:complete